MERGAEERDQSYYFHSAVLLIPSSTPTFCAYTAFLDYCDNSKPHIPTGGSMAAGSGGSPKSEGMLGMWHWAVWRGVRHSSCPPSHNPSPGAFLSSYLGWNRHRWTFIYLNITHTLTQHTLYCTSVCGRKTFWQDVCKRSRERMQQDNRPLLCAVPFLSPGAPAADSAWVTCECSLQTAFNSSSTPHICNKKLLCYVCVLIS